MDHKDEKIQALFQLILSAETEQDLADLFADLCTRREVENMAERVYAARLLLEGKTYNQIMELADISSATLSRVSRCVQRGAGYRKFLTPKEDK